MKLELSGNDIVLPSDYADLKSFPDKKWSNLYHSWKVPNSEENIKKLKNAGFEVSHLINRKVNNESAAMQHFISVRNKIKETYPFLYTYQLDAVAKGFINKKLLIADDVGLGKTIEGFAPMDRWLSNGVIKRVIIYCKVPTKKQWQRELKNWFNRDSIIVEGTAAERKAIYESKPQILLLNYEQLAPRKNSEFYDFPYIYELSLGQGLILDEATKVKNPKAKRTQYARMLKPNYLFALTGTPVDNKLIDAFHLGNLIHPGWMSTTEFYSYCVYERNEGGFNVLSEYKNLNIFNKRLMEIAIRRTWDDVGLQGPKVIQEDREIPLTLYQRKLQQMVVDTLNAEYSAGRISYSNINLPLFTFFPMLEDSTQLLNVSKAKSIQNLGEVKVENPKLDDLVEFMEELPDKKILIFTRFITMGHLIFNKLSEKRKCLLAVGDMTSKQKNEIRDIFKDTDASVLVATDCMSEAVDMPFVSVCINYDIPWKPSTLKQRAGRCRRANSKYDRLLVINYVSDGLESHIYKVLKEKNALFEEVTDFDLNKQLISFIRGFVPPK